MSLRSEKTHGNAPSLRIAFAHYPLEHLTPRPDNLDRRSTGLTLFLAAIVALTVFVRLRALPMPLERDEGEFAYMGQLMLQGIPPYKLAYNMKLPGTYAAYAGIMGLFGQTITGIHLGFLCVNLASIALLFLVARNWFGFRGAVVAASSFALLSASPGVLGLQGHATHLVAVFALAGLWQWQRCQKSPSALNLLLAGFLFGLSFLCKQPGLFFCFFGAAMALRDGTRISPPSWPRLMARLGLFSAAVVFPFAAVCLWLWSSGVFSRFWFWTFTYAKVHAVLLTPDAIAGAAHDFYANAGWIRLWWVPAVVGLIELFDSKSPEEWRFPLLAFLGFSFLAFCSGFYFWNHYFIVMLPAISLLIAAAVEALDETLSARGRLPKETTFALFACLCAFFIATQRQIWFRFSPSAACHAIYGENPFPEALEIARFIEDRAPKGQTIAILGSEPEIFFYAHRHSATGYIYTYDLVQLQKYALAMQQEMMRQIQDARPAFVLKVNIDMSWRIFPQVEAPDATIPLLWWARDFVKRDYQLVGVVKVYGDHADFLWNPKDTPRDSSGDVLIYERKDLLATRK